MLVKYALQSTLAKLLREMHCMRAIYEKLLSRNSTKRIAISELKYTIVSSRDMCEDPNYFL